MKIYGCDVGAKNIILHDGKNAYDISTPSEAKEIINEKCIIVLEQTGAYGSRWAEIFTSIGCKVFIADGRDFKNYRLAHSRKKDDRLDAFYLRKYYLEKEKRTKLRPYNPHQIYIRALIRQHIRNEKDITKHTNRLKQYLAMIFPFEEYHLLSRSKFFKSLTSIEKKLKQTPHTLSDIALTELKKLKIALEENQKLEKEIISIAKNHPGYEILKTFPIGDLQIATLLAYSWDIKDFKDKDKYIAYTLMGANLEQSGTSIYKVKTDKARTEIKGIFYTLYMQAHRRTQKWTHPLRPLTEFIKDLVNAKHNFKKRYIKFLSRFLELTFFARKYNLNFEETLKLKITRLEKELISLKEKEELTQNKIYKLYRLTRAINTYKQILNFALAQGKDISYLSQRKEEERQVYLRQIKNKEEKTKKEKTKKGGKTNENLHKKRTSKRTKTDTIKTTNRAKHKRNRRSNIKSNEISRREIEKLRRYKSRAKTLRSIHDKKQKTTPDTE